MQHQQPVQQLNMLESLLSAQQQQRNQMQRSFLSPMGYRLESPDSPANLSGTDMNLTAGFYSLPAHYNTAMHSKGSMYRDPSVLDNRHLLQQYMTQNLLPLGMNKIFPTTADASSMFLGAGTKPMPTLITTNNNFVQAMVQPTSARELAALTQYKHILPMISACEPGEKRKRAEEVESIPRTIPSRRKRPKMKDCSSVYRGVSWHKRDQRWIARLWINGKIRHLGSFRSEHRAALAVDRKLMSVYSVDAEPLLNFPDPSDRELVENGLEPKNIPKFRDEPEEEEQKSVSEEDR